MDVLLIKAGVNDVSYTTPLLTNGQRVIQSSIEQREETAEPLNSGDPGENAPAWFV